MSKRDKALTITWLFTILIVIFVIFDGILDYYLCILPSYYDPTLAILAMTLIAIIWYVYWTHRTVEAPREQDKKRNEQITKSLASALLSELQILDCSLRELYKLGLTAYKKPIVHPFLNESVKNLYLFGSQTIDLIVRFHHKIVNVNNIGEYYSMIKSINLSKYGKLFQIKIDEACYSLIDLVKALRDQGADEPKQGVYEERDINKPVPPLPESPFPETIIKP